jgi:hypothetical protein
MDHALSLEQKIEVAQRASDVALDALGQFCSEQGLPLAEVTAWSTAWETGGEPGVRALVERWRPEAAQARAWQDEIKNALKLFRPRAFRVNPDGNCFTVEEVKPLTARSIVHTPFFQLRVVREGEGPRWFLYWRRADGQWWPYAGAPSFGAVLEAIAEVQADKHRCFRLHPLH